MAKQGKKAKTAKTAKFDITEHNLVPAHTKMSSKEKKDLLTRYNITVNQLPQISINDPVIKGMGAKSGDVIKIERKSETAGTAVYYRGVVGE